MLDDLRDCSGKGLLALLQLLPGARDCKLCVRIVVEGTFQDLDCKAFTHYAVFTRCLQGALDACDLALRKPGLAQQLQSGQTQAYREKRLQKRRGVLQQPQDAACTERHQKSRAALRPLGRTSMPGGLGRAAGAKFPKPG